MVVHSFKLSTTFFTETQLFNLDDHQHYRLEALSSSTPSNAFIPPSNNTARLETIKAELWTGAPQTWSHSSSQSQATNTPGHPSTQIINKSQNKIFKRRLRRRRRRGASKGEELHDVILIDLKNDVIY